MSNLHIDRRGASPRSIARLGVGLLLVAASVGLIGAGAFAAWARTGSTYFGLGAHGTYRTDGYAVATDSTNWRTTFLGWAGSVQLKVASGDQTPVFVGVAPPRTVSRYLRGVDYTTISEHTGRREHDGTVAPPPTTLTAWTAHVEGTGIQTLHWPATNGPQVVLAMNADRSQPVQVRVVSSAITLQRMPWSVPIGLVVGGIVMLAVSAVVLRRVLTRG